jgi:hypothetical protein
VAIEMSNSSMEEELALMSQVERVQIGTLSTNNTKGLIRFIRDSSRV